ncbi:hypothetical protein GT037_008640 [Alternaria burnsii]|uniref:Uncharacterized protein n=1 Tax=Alternaria burnsii TaxID=1187904 RepID=A0A8H7B1R7_9PLEO|nr:uncharacterized protein GT037_008640 [Alternaria burnsii]KAF7673317.1 hypothetical protein GT037_008640 [Alternaria burnsii]
MAMPILNALYRDIAMDWEGASSGPLEGAGFSDVPFLIHHLISARIDGSTANGASSAMNHTLCNEPSLSDVPLLGCCARRRRVYNAHQRKQTQMQYRDVLNRQ